MNRAWRAGLCAVLGLAAACVAPQPESSGAGTRAFRDLAGAPQLPLAPEDRVGHVLIFSTVDCPIANGYAPTINALASEFASSSLGFFLVHVDPDVQPDQAREHAEAYAYRMPVLIDARHDLARWAGVTVTPEAAVIDARGVLVYRGRIDDTYRALGKKRPRPTASELRDALEALVAGRSVPVARTQAVGCLLPLLPPTGSAR